MPRYSIVIPTRHGSQTLRATLRTVLAVDYDDYEVLVCDNDTSDATRQLIDELASPRVRYVRAPRPLSMASNWELAVSEARGDYVTVLGDDDGLMPFALRELDTLLRLTGLRAVRWEAAFFVWPDVGLPEQSDYLRIPSQRRVQVVEARPQIERVLSFEQCYTTLPMLYNSVVERSLLDELRRRAGRIFLDRVPDIASGFAIAHAAEVYTSTSIPMTVAGVSRKSTGLGTLFRRNEIGDDWHALNAGEDLTGSSALPDLFVFPTIPVAEAFLAVKQALFPDDNSLALDRRGLLASCLGALRTNSLAEWETAIDRLRCWTIDDPELRQALAVHLEQLVPQTSGPLPLRPERLGVADGCLHLGTAPFDVRDIADAVSLCHRLLLPRVREPYDFSARDELDLQQLYGSRSWHALQSLVAEKEAALQQAGRDLDLQRRHLEDLRARFEAQDRQLAAKERLLLNACQEAQGLQEQLQRKESALHAIHADAARLQTDLQAKQSALLSAHEQRQKLQLALEAKERALQEVHAALSVQRQQAQQVHEMLQAKHAALIAALDQGAELQTALQEKHAALEAAHQALLEKHDALHAALAAAARLQTQLVELDAELEEARRTVVALRNRSLWKRLRNAA